MRSKRLFKTLGLTLLLIVLAAGVMACNKDDDDEYWTITLDGYKTTHTGYPDQMSYEVIRGIKDNGEVYYFYAGEIEGFTYEEGYIYKVRIRVTPVLQQIGTCNPPPYTFKLVKIISKTCVCYDDAL